MVGKDKKKRAEPKKPGKDDSLAWKAWYFIWYDDSIWSWIVNIMLAFIIIKYLFYPGLGLVFGTSFPIVAVVSNSMEHHTDFDNWWQQNEDFYLSFNITKAEFSDYPYVNGFNKGDIMILVGTKPEKINLGDVIVFQSKKPYPIIHRVIDKDEKGMWVFQTKGDNNKAQIAPPLDSQLDERNVLETAVLGKAVFRIPWLGYVKIWAVDLLRMIGFSNII